MATLKKGPHLDFGLGEICQRDRAFKTLCNLKKLCLGCEEVRKVCKVLLEDLEVHKYSYKRFRTGAKTLGLSDPLAATSRLHFETVV